MIALSAFADEIDQDLAVQIRELRAEQIKHIEFRAAWGKNVLDLSDADLDRARQMLDENLMRVSAVGSPIGKVRIHEDFEPHLARFRRALVVAQRLDASYVRIFSFYGSDGKPPVNAREEVIRRLKLFTSMAQDAGVVLCHENEKDIYGDTPERCADLLESIHSPWLRAVYDPANFVQIGLRPYEQCWPLLRDHLEYFHIKDARLETGGVVPAGEGDGGLEETLRDALARGFSGFCSLEPHLQHAGQFSGRTGPELFHVAAQAFKRIVERAGGRWQPVRVAVVGAGLIGRFHLEAIGQARDTVAVGIADTVSERAEALAAKHSLPAYSDLAVLVRQQRPDFVTVCTPSGAHLDVCEAVAPHGVSVLTEKPLEITLERADRMIRLCREHGVALGVVFQSRYLSDLVRVKALIDSGRLGRILVANVYNKWFRPQSYYDTGGWRGTWRLDGGGALMNQAIHYVDLLLWLAGDVSWVTAQTATLRHKMETEDHAAATVRFANGAVGTLVASTAMWPGFERSIEIVGERGTVIICDDRVQFCAIEGEKDPPAGIEIKPPAETSAADPAAGLRGRHAPVIADFARAVAEGKPPACSGEEGRRAVELILAVYESARRGQPVTLPLT